MRMAAEGEAAGSPLKRVARMASGNAVVLFSVSGCCMCYAVQRFLLGMGVGPTVYELDDKAAGGGGDIQAVLAHLLAEGCGVTDHFASSANASGLPAVFVGGKLLGGVEELMSCHINGSLVPLLKQAGALWL